MWLAACDPDSKTGSRPERDSHAYGRIFTFAGEPAVGSKVGFWPVDEWPSCPSTDTPRPEPVYSVLTDESGKYRMDSIPDGQFNMIAEWNGEMVFRGPINPRSPTHIPGKDTLQAAASLGGGIGLPFAVDPGDFCLQVKGTPFSTRVGLDDRFSFDSLPAGLLDMRLQSWLPNYDAILFQKSLSAGERDSLDMESGYSGHLGKTYTLEASHDSHSGNVTLRWDRAARPGTLYDVYRVPKDSIILPTRLAAWEETTFVDMRSDEIHDTVMKGGAYRYWIAAKAVTRADSMIYDSTDISLPDIGISAQFTVISLTSRPEYFSQGDSLHIALQYRLPIRRIRKVEWFDEENGKLLHMRSDDSFEGRDTLKHRWRDNPLRNERQYVWQERGIDSGETIRLKVQFTDESSGKWVQRFDVFMMADSVRAYGVPDQRVGINQSIQLQGTASRRYGPFVGWDWDQAWDCGGTGTWKQTSDGKITIHAPPQAMESYTCIFRATDNRGASGYDTVQVRVDASLPEYFVQYLPDIDADQFYGFASGGRTVLVSGGNEGQRHNTYYIWSHEGDRWGYEGDLGLDRIFSSQFGMVSIGDEGYMKLMDGPRVIQPQRIGTQHPFRLPDGGVIGADRILACRNGSCFNMSTTGPPVETQDALLLTAIREETISFKARIAFLPRAGGVHPGIGDGLLYDPSSQTWSGLPPRILGQPIGGVNQMKSFTSSRRMGKWKPTVPTLMRGNGKAVPVSREPMSLPSTEKSSSWPGKARSSACPHTTAKTIPGA